MYQNVNVAPIGFGLRTETQLDAAGNPYLKHDWNKVREYCNEYDHLIWKRYKNNPVGGHN